MKKPTTYNLQPTTYKKGFVLLFTILVSSIVLLIALGISGIAYRQIILSSEARDGGIAFFAADSGVECALYALNKKNSIVPGEDGVWEISQTFLCNGEIIGSIADLSEGFLVGPNRNNCARVELLGFGDSPVIESRGSNVLCTNLASPRAVERAIRVSY